MRFRHGFVVNEINRQNRGVGPGRPGGPWGAFSDQSFSLSDRTSWAVMERLGIHEAVSLDNDFRIYRFGPDRRRFFTVSP